MNINAKPPIFFAIPGDINSHTGGYGYGRRLIAELRALDYPIELVQLSGRFPQPTELDLVDAEEKLAALPDEAILLADGLAFGVMDASAIKHGNRLKIIALCHHPLALETGLGTAEQTAFKLSETRALKAASAILVTSKATARILQQEFDITTPIQVAEPGTDRQHFANCIGEPPILLTVASLTRRKGHDLLIDALAKIPHLPWQAHFVGGKDFDREWATHLQQQVENHGLTKRILLLGKLADTAVEYAQADIFVLPSHYEGYGMAFAEALAYGLPIVAARAGAVPDLIPGTAGMLVPPADSQYLADVLEQLLSNPTKRRRLQAGARKAAETLPSWQDTAKQVADIIQTLRQL